MVLIGQILLWVLWIVLGLLGLVLVVLLLALLLPVRVWLRYDKAGFAVKLQILFFRLQLLPEKKKAARKEQTERKISVQKPTNIEPKPDTGKKKPEAAGSGSKSKPERPKNAAKTAADGQQPMVRRILESLPAVLDMAGCFLGAVLRSLRFTHLTVVMPVSGGEPDAVARKVGKANAWFYGIVSPLGNALHLKWKQVRIFPDYQDEHGEELLLAACVRGQLMPVAIAALHLFCSLKKENIL
ncbi:MAG: hypothetical protein IJ412_04605 [Oscillospiraceae bacterium]|nr:hypothetical protein [Oscillospiraceae bacterium]